MILEIKEQALLERSDSRVLLRGVAGIWEPELHTLRISFKDSNFETDADGNIVFPIVVSCVLDNDEGGKEIFSIDRESHEEYYTWSLNSLNILLDIVFPDTVCADIVPENTEKTPDIQYIESFGKAISGNLYDLLSTSLSSSDLNKLADKESWYRYIRISSDKSLSSAQHIDKDGKIISQEYIYYKYKNLKVFFDGGLSRLFNLSPDTQFLRLSGYADREEYYVKGDSDPVLLGTTVVHIKEVPGLVINPRSKDRELFKGRFNYTSFTLFCGEIDGVSLVSDSPVSINFISYNSSQMQISNNISFGSGEPKNDIWEYLEASTDLETYRDELNNPLFFLSGKTTISFTIWNAFRETVLYNSSNTELRGDIASHFTLKLLSWNISEWVKGDVHKNGVLEVNLTSDGTENLEGRLSIVDTEDDTIIATIYVKTLSNPSQIIAIGENGEGLKALGFSPREGDTSENFNVLGVSNEYDSVKYKFFNVYDLNCPLTGNQSHSVVSVSIEDGERANIVKSDKATYTADLEEVNLSMFVNQDIILNYGKSYKLIAPGDFYIPDGDSYLSGDSGTEKTFLIPNHIEGDIYQVSYYFGSSETLSSTNIHLIKKLQEIDPISLDYSGFRSQESKKFLFGYLLAGFDIESVSATSRSAALIPVCTLPNVTCTTRTAYDRTQASADIFNDVPEVVDAVNNAVNNLGVSERNIILGVGKTWIDVITPNGYYENPDGTTTDITYEIRRPVSSNPEYVQVDLEKWDELYYGKSVINVVSNSSVRVPIEIKKLPATGVLNVIITIQVGDDTMLSSVSETFHLLPEIRNISFDGNEDMISDDIIIYQEPIDVTTPYHTKFGDNGSTIYDFGPAYGSINHNPSQTIKTKIYTTSKISASDIGIHDGNLTRDTQNFSWSSEVNQSRLLSFSETGSRNEYNDPSYKSRFVPEYREYTINHLLDKRDDYFPQYPISRIDIRFNNEVLKLYSFYMPVNPYIKSMIAGTHYLYVSDEVEQQLRAYNANPDTAPHPIVTGSFEFKSNYFLFNNLSNSDTDINLPSGYDSEQYKRLPVRYLFHNYGDIFKSSYGEIYDSPSAFKEGFTVRKTSDTATESSAIVNYSFDLSQWSGNYSDPNTNFVAEIYIVDPADSHRSIFPLSSQLSSIIGREAINWEYTRVDLSEAYIDYSDNTSIISVPGPQYPSSESYIQFKDSVDGVVDYISSLSSRYQLRISNERMDNENLSVSCYGTTYLWEVDGHWTKDQLSITPSTQLNKRYRVIEEINDSDIEFVGSGSTEKSEIKVVINKNLDSGGIEPGAQILDEHYNKRTGSVSTSGGKYLIVEQQPSDGYFYISSDTIPDRIYQASQQLDSNTSLVDETVAVSKSTTQVTLNFEYLSTTNIREYMKLMGSGRTFFEYVTYPFRDRVDWNSDTNPIFDIETSGDLNIIPEVNISSIREDGLNVGSITLNFDENLNDGEKTGVLKIVRRDNGSTLVKITIIQGGYVIATKYSGIINSSGDGRLVLYTKQPMSSLEFTGLTEDILYMGQLDDGALQYFIKVPENHTPVPITRELIITNIDSDGEYHVYLTQGYCGIYIWKSGHNDHSLDCDSNGKYVFGSMNVPENLNSKYYFDYYYSEPVGDEDSIETQLSEPTRLYSYYDATKQKIKSIKYQIVSQNEASYEVSDVFASLSTDVVYNGTVEDPYPYIQTLGTVYENKKELGLCLVAEIELSMDYTTEIRFLSGSNSITKETQTLEATNKIQIWYKI